MVLQVKLRVDGPEIDLEAYKKEAVDGMSRLWKDSIEAFVKEMAFSLMFEYNHVDTGMTVASLGPLAAKVRFRSMLMTGIKAKSNGPKSGGQFLGARGSAGSGFVKSIAMGERLGEDAFTIKMPTANDMSMDFEFRIVVLQHFLHEGANWKGGKGMKSIDRSRVAMRRFFLENKNNPKYKPETRKWLRQRSWVK